MGAFSGTGPFSVISRGGGGGGTGGTPVTATASITGNETETLYDNTSGTALSQTGGTASYARTFDLDLGRSLTAADDGKDLRVRFSYEQSTAGRYFDVVVAASDFRSWTAFTTSSGTTGVPVGNRKFSISRGVSSSNSLTGIWNRQGMIFRRGDSSGNMVLGIVIPAGDSADYAAISNMRGTIELIPRVSEIGVDLEIDGATTVIQNERRDVKGEEIGSGNVNVTISNAWPSAANIARIEIPEGDDAPDYLLVNLGEGASGRNQAGATWWVDRAALLLKEEGEYNTAAEEDERLLLQDSAGVGTDAFLGWTTDPNDSTTKLLLFTSGSASSADARPLTVSKPYVNVPVGVSGSGGGGDSDSGGSLETFLGLPDPSADYENQVVVNRIDRREYICENDPHVNEAATGTLEDLDTYYTTDDANLRVFHALPAVSSSDDDTWIYIDTDDKFYFGDTAFSSTYAWYEDSPADALREVCRAYVENAASTSIENLGAGAPVVYLGQHQDEADILASLHNLTLDFTTNYYVAWNIQKQVFQIVEDDYTAPGTVVNHYTWKNVRAEAINPILRPHQSGQFPTPTAQMFEENAILVDFNGNSWHIKQVGHGAQSARGTWDDYDAGDTLPGFGSNDDWKGVVSRVSDVDSPDQYDTVVVVNGFHAQLEQFFDVPGSNGWFNYVVFGVHLLGAFRNQEDADSAVTNWASGDNLYAVWGGQIHRLTAYTPGTASTHRYSWVPAAQTGNPTAIFYGHGQTERFTASTPGTYVDEDVSAVRFADPSNANAREYFNGGEDVFGDMFVAVSDIPADADDLDGSGQLTFMYWKPPAGRYDISLWFRTNSSLASTDNIDLRSVASGTDTMEIPGNSIASNRSISLRGRDIVTDGTKVFWWRLDRIGTPRVAASMRIEKVA